MWAWQVEFADNQECIDLIELAPEGIFPTLEEELNMPKASDLTFTEKVVISAAVSHCHSYRLFVSFLPLIRVTRTALSVVCSGLSLTEKVGPYLLPVAPTQCIAAAAAGRNALWHARHSVLPLASTLE